MLCLVMIFKLPLPFNLVRPFIALQTVALAGLFIAFQPFYCLSALLGLLVL